MQMKGKLFLIPTTLGDCSIDYSIPRDISSIIGRLNVYIVENIKTARRYIRKADKNKDIDKIEFLVLNKHTKEQEIPDFLKPLKEGHDVGIISEAGVPGVADPGAAIVELAHKEEIRVVPLVGPSSIILALMASGLNGQNFAFRGYLPIKNYERIKSLKRLEKISKTEHQTQIFMETPYRNNKLLEIILENCSPKTSLCIASNITCNDEFIQTKTIEKWKKEIPNLHKKPAIFLLHSY